jgi:hypothetical protein
MFFAFQIAPFQPEVNSSQPLETFARIDFNFWFSVIPVSQACETMPAKRAVRKRAVSSTAPTGRVAKKGKNKELSEESARDESPDAGDSADDDDDGSSFEADEDAEEEEDSDGDASVVSSEHSEPPPRSRRVSRNAPESSRKATSRKPGRPSAGAASGASGEPGSLPDGLEVRIKRPQARKAGATPYMDETIHPNTFLFLGDLAANNQREWLKCELLHLLLEADHLELRLSL